MTKDERQRRGRNLCRRLSEAVAAFSPDGLGTSLPDPHPARTASDDFLDVLSKWEREEASVDQVREAYDAALEAWRLAAETFRSELERGTETSNRAEV